jgi:hypothetical protein
MLINKKLCGGMLVVLLAGFAFWFNVTQAVRRPMCDGIYSGRLYCRHNKNIELTLAIKGGKYKLELCYLDDADVDSLSDEGRVVYRGDIIEIGRGSNMYYHVTEHGELRQMDRQAKEVMAGYALKKV